MEFIVKGELNFEYNPNVELRFSKILNIPKKGLYNFKITWTISSLRTHPYSRIFLDERTISVFGSKNIQLRIKEHNLHGGDHLITDHVISNQFSYCTEKNDFNFIEYTFLNESGCDFIGNDDSQVSYQELALQDLTEAFAKILAKSSGKVVRITCADRVEIEANKEMLCLRSEVFDSMLNSGMLEGQTMTISSQFTSLVIKSLLDYFTTGIVKDCDYEELFHAADYYKLLKLKDICLQLLSKTLDSENCMSRICLAHTYNLTNLRNQCAQFIANNLEKIKE